MNSDNHNSSSTAARPDVDGDALLRDRLALGLTRREVCRLAPCSPSHLGSVEAGIIRGGEVAGRVRAALDRVRDERAASAANPSDSRR